jgi:hypothetical protein
MPNPTTEQNLEMLDVLKTAHGWIDTMQIAGIAENVIVCAVHTALVERSLRAGGVEKTCQWLQGQADMVHILGHELLAEIKRKGVDFSSEIC